MLLSEVVDSFTKIEISTWHGSIIASFRFKLPKFPRKVLSGFLQNFELTAGDMQNWQAEIENEGIKIWPVDQEFHSTDEKQ